MTLEVENLCSLAEQALDESADMEARLLAVEEYTEQFRIWHESFDSTQEISAEQRLELENLAKCHEQVLAFVNELRNTSAKELRDFKTKAKGIMAYTDRLPRRISIAAKRKG
ncbi:MAG: hypothetical protein KDD62_02215 [Bdellovibrionales bacterium]|nr:hypothetical protein [Bdellovibrionales bacterium]